MGELCLHEIRYLKIHEFQTITLSKHSPSILFSKTITRMLASFRHIVANQDKSNGRDCLKFEMIGSVFVVFQN